MAVDHPRARSVPLIPFGRFDNVMKYEFHTRKFESFREHVSRIIQVSSQCRIVRAFREFQGHRRPIRIRFRFVWPQGSLVFVLQ